MGSPLRVHPEVLRAAASDQGRIGTELSGLGVGQSLTASAGALAGLHISGACQLAGSVLDKVAGGVGEDLCTHAENLRSAAGTYERTDVEWGRRIRQAEKAIEQTRQ